MPELPDFTPRLDREALVRLAMDLIRHESEAPPGREEGVARFAAEQLRGLGFEAEVDPVAPGRANAIGRLRGAGGPGARTLAFNGHLDVVPRGEAAWTSPPYAPEIRGGRLYGRGAADMKGGIAAAMHAAAMLRAAGVRLRGDLLFALDADEEVNNIGLRKMLADKVFAGVSACVIGEPTGLDIAVGHRGVGGVGAIFAGSATHAAQAWRGVNAVAHACRFVQKVEELCRRKLRDRNHPLLGPSLVTPTLMHGGFRINVVPSRCELSLDLRMIPGESLDSAMAELAGLAEELRREVPDLDVSFRPTTYCPPGLTDAGHPVVAALREAALGVPGAGGGIKGFEASGELSMIAEGSGTPTVFFGPGGIAQAHTVDEFVEVEQLALAALVYARAFAIYLGVA